MKKYIIYIPLIIVTLLIVTGVYLFFTFSGSQKQFVTSFTKGSSVKESEGRTNILVVGVDTRDSEYLQTGTLTDTMILASINFKEKDVKLLSLPRDLWVSTELGSMKINEVYTTNSFEELVGVVERELGLDVHYRAQVNFEAFEKVIDAVGGVTINNPAYFADNYYPKFGWENETCGIDLEKLKEEKEEAGEEITEYDFPCRFERVVFEKGEISLTGEEALKYARSRHSLDSNQGTDFARAKRQHLVIEALISKVLSTNTISDFSKVKELFQLSTELVKTDFTINELIILSKYYTTASDFTFNSAVLSDSNKFEEGGVLVQGNSENYGGRYVLIEREAGGIISFVNTYLYGSNATETTE